MVPECNRRVAASKPSGDNKGAPGPAWNPGGRRGNDRTSQRGSPMMRGGSPTQRLLGNSDGADSVAPTRAEPGGRVTGGRRRGPCAERSQHPQRRTKPIPVAPNEAIGKLGKAPNEANEPRSAPNEAIGKMGKAPNEANEHCPALNEAIDKLGKAPNEANSQSAERSQFLPRRTKPVRAAGRVPGVEAARRLRQTPRASGGSTARKGRGPTSLVCESSLTPGEFEPRTSGG
jgi:hypothetical protein